MLYSSKTMKKSMLMLCMSALLVPATTRAHDGWAVPAMAVGGLALAAGAAYYAFSESDATIVHNAEIALDETLKLYKADVEAFLVFHGVTHYPTNINAFINNADEVEELFTTAQRLIANNTRMQTYLDCTYDYVSRLYASHAKLEKRIYSLERSRNLRPEEVVLLQRMRRVYAEIGDFVQYLSLYHTFFAEHCAYFNLYECETKLYRVYQQEFNYGNAYQYDALALGQALRQCVGARCAHEQYPFLAYKDYLDDDIKALQSHMRYAKRYANRYACASILEQYLIRVRGIILADPSYQHEKETRKRDRERREQQQLMQQQIAAQQQLASAQQAYANAVNTATVVNAIKPGCVVHVHK